MTTPPVFGTHTPNLNLFKPDGDSWMGAVDDNLNDNWTKIEGMDAITTITGNALPTSGSYVAGDLIFVSDWRDQFAVVVGAVFQCVANVAPWGPIWRPLTRMWTPWQDMASSLILSGWSAVAGLTPQYHVSINGYMEIRGRLRVNSGVLTGNANGYGEAAIMPAPFPVAVMPRYTVEKTAAINPINSNNTQQMQVGSFAVGSTADSFGLYAAWWNPLATAVAITLDGMYWPMESSY